MGAREARALEALREYSAENGVPNPHGAGWPEAGQVKIVDLSAFTEFAAGRETADEPKRRREQAKRGIDGLVSKKLAATNEDWIWAC
jgi:hypothetical protein